MAEKARGSGSIGASSTAIQAHYDLSDDFYRLWLDASMTYSCGFWDEAGTLEQAQERKLDFHAGQARAEGAQRVLDVGCGWGSMLRRLAHEHRVERAVGLTLSESQFKHVESLGDPRIDVLMESWADHEPARPYDAIVCIGALEHFVRPETPPDERIEIYRTFFARCRDLTRPGAWMSLQTIAYGVGDFTTGAISTIFPESDLPRLSQIAAASEGSFEIVSLRNDRADYARTCGEWLRRMRARRDEAASIVGEATTRHYERFLDASTRGFDSHVFCLFRMALRRIDLPG